MATKEQPIQPAGMLTVQDITAWYQDNPWPLGNVDAYFPLEMSDEDTWKTISPTSYLMNEAADPLSQSSSIPVAGREGFKTVMGGMAEFGKGREMTNKQIQQFEKLKKLVMETKNPAIAQQLVNYYGADLQFVRTAMMSERTYLSYALLSSACNIGFTAANSPYMQSLVNQDYPVEAWQKDDVSTSWSNAAAEILTDIQNVIDTAEARGKYLKKIKINRKWFGYVRMNTQVQKYCATMVQNLYSTQAPPTLLAINTMLQGYFDSDIAFEVIDDKITRANADGTKTTAEAFADGVAVFTMDTQVGRFVWNPIYIDSPTQEIAESFFIVGNYKKVDPNWNKIYAKSKGFPVIDTYADNFYLKVNAVAW
jgi:hypothetical protein